MSLLNVLDWSRKKDNIPLIFAGSASRYGNVYDNPYAQTDWSEPLAVPEPSITTLLMVGIIVLAFLKRRVEPSAPMWSWKSGFRKAK